MLARLPRPLKRLAVAALALVVPLVGAELVLRWCGFEYPPLPPLQIWNRFNDRQIRLGKDLHEHAPRQIWRPRAGADVPWGGTINARGYRGPLLEPAKTPGRLRIAALGDSSTFGYGVGPEETYAARLERLLDAAGQECEVLNAGVIGFTIRQGLERYDELVRAYRPDVVIAAFAGVNEYRLARQALPDREKTAQLGPAGGFWQEVGFTLREHARVLHLLARGADLLQGVTAEEREARFEEHDRESVLARQAGALDFGGVRRVSPEDFEACLLELQRRVEGDGARLILLALPLQPTTAEQTPVLREYARRIAEVGAHQGLTVVDGPGAYDRALASGATLEQLFTDAFHPSAAGHEVLARELGTALGVR